MSNRILMLAPHPLLEPRGSSIHVYQRLQVLADLGYRVDVIAYPFGEPVAIPGVRVWRCGKPWGLKGVRIGPSPAKILLDVFLLLRTLRAVATHRYAAIHSNEEAAFPGLVVSRLLRIPHVYDMHSVLSEQFELRATRGSQLAARLFAKLERWAITRSRLVIAISPAIAAFMQSFTTPEQLRVIENTWSPDAPEPSAAPGLRHTLGLDGTRVVMYVGNFQPYQGLDLLSQAFPEVRARAPASRLVLVGGKPDEIEALRAQLPDAVFTGEVPLDEVGRYLQLADVLVAPRLAGSNTPMKIYGYLAAGKPVVATDIPGHTTVLPGADVHLCSPHAPSVAAAIIAALARIDGGEETRGAPLRELAQLGEATYREAVREAYAVALGVDP